MARSYESDANDNHIVKENSTASSGSKDTVPHTTSLGRKPVPVTSSCKGLFDDLEECRGDIPFTAELLRSSKVDFTDNQLVLVQDVLEAAKIAMRYGFERAFYNAIVALGESLELRIVEEEKFLVQQKMRYTRIYEILRQSSFPFSADQSRSLNRMLGALYVITGNPSAEADEEFMAGLRELVRLLQGEDHLRDTSPHRVMVTNTIHFYLHKMVVQLGCLAKEESERPHPDFIHPHCVINLATYLVVNLEGLVDVSKVLTQREHFHWGMVEIYTKFISIFKDSGLDFSYVQHVVTQKIERRVSELKKSPSMSKHHEIREDCLEFITELEENNPDREITLVGDRAMWAVNGKVNRIVKEIAWSLIYLQPVVSEHLANFPCFGNGIVDVIAQVTERFLTLYPMC